MKILVTGGAGFIGSHLVDAYLAKGYKVHVIDNFYSGDKSLVNKKCVFHEFDIKDSKTYDLIIKEKFDIISHQAAQVDVRVALLKPILDCEINILGTINILEAAKEAKVKRIIFPSSGGAVYGEIPDRDLPPKEGYPINPISQYGVAKHAIEHYLFLYKKIYGLDYIVLRYGNVYGERQGKKGEAGVISIFARALLNKNTVNIYGDGEQLRDYVYIKDIVNANMVASNLSFNIPNEVKDFNDLCFNIGSGIGSSVNELYKIMVEWLKLSLKPKYCLKRPGEIEKTYLEITKANRILGWTPQTPLKEGIEATMKWFKDNPEF